MTKKLYYDPEMKTCSAAVLDVRESKGGYEILLDQTVIYPEGGGQLSDTGMIGSAKVSHAREEDDRIWHLADKPLAVGETAEVSFDPLPRLDHTQQHTGEHILSGLAKTLFDAVNVGFHMAEDYATIDLDKPLDDAQLAHLETEANRAVQANVPTVTRIVNDKELDSIEIRKRAKGLAGDNIRIVWCGGVDSCTCCGTHCVMSGEVGFIKITAHMNYKGGTRLWFACGMRAVKHAQETAALADKLARRFSTKQENVLEAVVKQGDDLAAAKKELRVRTDMLLSYRAADLLANADAVGGTKLVVSLEDGFAMQELKLLAEKVCTAEKAVAVLLSKAGESVYYQLWRSQGVALSMRDVSSALNAILGGKGGGRDDAAQGSAKAQEGLSETLAQFEAYMKQRMKG